MKFESASETYFFIITGVILLNLFLVFIVYFVFFYRKRQKENQAEKNQLILQFEKTQLESQLEIQENTFKNISMEIHDNIGQVLSLAKLNLAKMELPSAEPASELINSTKQLVGKAIQDLRDLSKSLNTEYIHEMGLEKAIEYELSMIRKLGDFEVSFISNAVSRYEKKTEIIIFRMVQELLNNIVKHAEAHLIEVTLLNDDKQLILSVHDNGKGFGEVPGGRAGIGLQNMRDRARMIHADFEITSVTGNGTTAILTIPHIH